MTAILEEQQPAVSEPEVVETEVQDEVIIESPRTVPLEALEAERRKRQDLEAQNRVLQDFMMKSKTVEKPLDDTEDDEEFITKAEMKSRLKEVSFSQKREVLEEAFCDSKPEAISLINSHLEEIIKRKPWLAQSIESAPNRYARAYEIVQDYMPKENVAPVQKFSSPKTDAKKIVENSQKPVNPATIAKASQGSTQEYLKSIQGKPEFREYRKKMLAGG